MGKEEGSVKVIPTIEAKKSRSNTMAFNSRTRWSSSAVLSDPLWLRHSEMIWSTTNILRLNSDAIVRNVTKSGMTNTSICWHEKNPCSILSSNHTHPWAIPSFPLASNALMIWRVRWCSRMNMTTWWNCGRPSISRHGVSTTNCTIYSRCDSHGRCIWILPKHHT